jgi:hypothetical protein
MRLSPFALSALSVWMAPAAAHAQSAPAAQAAAPAQDVPLAQRLRTERPEIDRLLEAYQPKEALVKAEALLPAQTPAWDKTDGNTQYKSYLLLQDQAQAYFLAYRAAVASGEWEKAQDYVKKAQGCMVTNKTEAEALFPKIVDAYMGRVNQNRNALKADESYIKDLKAKPNPDAGDKQQLDLVAGLEKTIVEDEKWANFFRGFIEAAKKDAVRYDPWVKVMEDRLKIEADQIAEYKAGKGDKAKWVEAIVSNPSYLKNFAEQRDRVDFLFRLSVLDPTNKKVDHEIDVQLGKVPATPTKPAKKHKKG